MANNEFSQPIKLMVGGNIDALNKVYADVATANTAIPNVVGGNGLNYRSGKAVQIGTEINHKEYRWSGGYEDINLVEYTAGSGGTEQWIAKVYLAGKQSVDKGKIWEANANTLPTDVPGVSLKWVEVLNYASNPSDFFTPPNGVQSMTINPIVDTPTGTATTSNKTTIVINSTFGLSGYNGYVESFSALFTTTVESGRQGNFYIVRKQANGNYKVIYDSGLVNLGLGGINTYTPTKGAVRIQTGDAIGIYVTGTVSKNIRIVINGDPTGGNIILTSAPILGNEYAPVTGGNSNYYHKYLFGAKVVKIGEQVVSLGWANTPFGWVQLDSNNYIPKSLINTNEIPSKESVSQLTPTDFFTPPSSGTMTIAPLGTVTLNGSAPTTQRMTIVTNTTWGLSGYKGYVEAFYCEFSAVDATRQAIFYVLNKQVNGAYKVTYESPLVTVGLGIGNVNVYTPPVGSAKIQIGDVIGIFVNSTTSNLRLNQTGDPTNGNILLNAPLFLGSEYSSATSGAASSGYRYSLSAKVVKFENFMLPVGWAGKPYGWVQLDGSGLIPKSLIPSNSKSKTAVLYTDNFSSSDWIKTNWTIDSNGYASTSSVGAANAITLNRAYGAQGRYARITFKQSSDSIAVFATHGKENNTDRIYSEVYVNAATGKFFIGSRDGTNVASSAQTDFIYNVNHIYMIEVNRGISTISARLKNMTTAQVWAIEDFANTTGFTAKGNDVYYNYLYSGTSLLITSFSLTSSKKGIMFYGDSITEGANLIIDGTAQRWIDIVTDKRLGDGMGDGRSSGTIIGGFERMQNELPYLLPDYVMLTFGTNGLNTYANLTEAILYIKSLGIVPILNHIPRINTGIQVAVNLLIDTVVAEQKIACCKFDIATSINNDISQGQNLSLFTSDQVHPNKAGHLAMFNRTLVDCPFIYG